jgi:TolB protein
MDTLTSQGVEAFRNGDTQQARALFKQAVEANPRSEDAWLWLSQLAENEAERAGYLRRVLDINPKNATARRGLEFTESRPAEGAPKAKGRAPAPSTPRKSRSRRAKLSAGQQLIGFVLAHPRQVTAVGGVGLALMAIVIIINSARNRPAAPTLEAVPTLTPLNNLIAYVSDRSGAPDLYVAQADGSGNPRRLTNDPNAESDPVWSPDSKQIAVKLSIAGDRADLYIIDPDRSESLRLATSIAIDQPVAWSPDGQRVAYVAESNNRLEIFVQPVRGDASSRVNISRSSANDYQPGWSPDGKQIAFVSDRADPPAIFVANADGSNAKPLFSDDTAQAYPTWSPDGRYLAYASSCRGDAAVSIVRSDGTASTRLAWVDAPADSLAWSPDGSALLYRSASHTYLVALDGRRPARLAWNAREDRSASWSPDGSRIVLAALDGSHFEVALINADGSGETTFRADAHQDTWPAWQPAKDRTPIAVAPLKLALNSIQACVPRDRIVFAAERGVGTHIYSLRVGDSLPKQLTSGAATDRSPGWSPDRRRIVFSSNRSGDFDIYTMNADGSDVKQLTRDKSNEDAPTWSPDAKLIAFQSDRGGSFNIYVVRPDGSGLQRVTEGEGDKTQPGWSPDGKQIAFAWNGDIYRVNLDGTYAMNVTHGAARDSDPAWSPDGQRIAFASIGPGSSQPRIYAVTLDGSEPEPLVDEPASHPAWSPDGRHTVYVSGQQIIDYDLKLHRRSVWVPAGGTGVTVGWPPAPFDPKLQVKAIPSPTATPTITPTPSRTASPTATSIPSRTPTRTITPTPSRAPTRPLPTPSATTKLTGTPTRTTTPTPH